LIITCAEFLSRGLTTLQAEPLRGSPGWDVGWGFRHPHPRTAV